MPAEDLRIGDVVVHEDHGVARLTGLRALDGDQPEERVALAFADGAELLAPLDELDRVWRYGGEDVAVSLDRMGGDAWRARRSAIEAEVRETAANLAAAALARSAAVAPVLEPPGPAMAAFARRFP